MQKLNITEKLLNNEFLKDRKNKPNIPMLVTTQYIHLDDILRNITDLIKDVLMPFLHITRFLFV